MTRASYEEQRRARPKERRLPRRPARRPDLERRQLGHLESLRWNLRTGLTMSLSGMFKIGRDVAGFSGQVPDPELLVRFTQAGALNPRFLMNSWKPDGTVTTPWLDAEAQPAIRLRYRLIPYLDSLYRRAAGHAEPILRPTFSDFPRIPQPSPRMTS